MFLVILFLSGSALLGAYLVHRFLRDYLNIAEQALWGTIVGWMLSLIATYLVARWQGKLSSAILLWITILIFAADSVLIVHSLRRGLVQKIRGFVWQSHFTSCLILLILFSPIYLLLFSSHFFARGNDGIYSGGSAAADLNFHAALSSSFLYGNNLSPKYTPFFPQPLTYPFLPDFQTAVLMTAGISMRSALLITSLTLALVTTALMFYLALRIMKQQFVASIATILFLLNGGLGFIDLLRDWAHGSKSFFQFWNTLEVNYANYAARGLHWPNIITDGFVPQRTLLFGLPVALMVIAAFATGFLGDASEKPAATKLIDLSATRNRALLLAGVLTGLLPLFHIHTYIALGLLSCFLFVVQPRRVWFLFWIPAVVLSAPRIYSLITGPTVMDFLRLQLGWMGHQSFIPVYLLRNLGLPLLLAIPAWFVLTRTMRKFYLPFLLLLAFCLTVIVSPNTFDNGKLIYYWHIVNSVIVANWLFKLYATHKQRVLAVAILLLCVATGVTAIHSESLQNYKIFDDDDLAASEFVKSKTLAQALFLTPPTVNEPVLSLAGRPILRGPTAWLWSHGYEFRSREADVRRIYAGCDDARELLQQYGIDYIFVGNSEKTQLNANQRFFDDNFLVAFRNPSISIYEVPPLHNKPPVGVDARSLDARVAYDPFALLAEFPQTTYFVYRMFLVGERRILRVDEMLNAMRLLGRGVAIGSAEGKLQLEKNRVDLLNSFLASQEERWGRLSNREFVETILSNADLPTKDRFQRLMEMFDSASESRATIFRRVIDDRELYKREYNRAFVLAHYFGYFHRNPDDSPDTNMDGFNYWLEILNASGDYRSLSRAFLESEEYTSMSQCRNGK